MTAMDDDMLNCRRQARSIYAADMREFYRFFDMGLERLVRVVAVLVVVGAGVRVPWLISCVFDWSRMWGWSPAALVCRMSAQGIDAQTL